MVYNKKVCRIEKKFGDLKVANRTALVTFITAGDPSFNLSKEILLNLPKAGADIIEIGVPFSDPMADGPIIQKSYKRALKNRINLDKVLNLVKIFRKEDKNTPIILMGYYNPIYRKGIKLFFDQAQKVGVDGLLIVDLPPENDDEIQKYLKAFNLKVIRLASPTTNRSRLKKILKISSGFLYYVSITGITGTGLNKTSSVKKVYSRLKKYTKIPIVVGFGINTPEKAKIVSKYADGVVVGSAIVKEIDKKFGKKNNILGLVKKFSKAVKEARK
ncbi:tryptophan synthase subunit alpha [Alphaproteobacteria bacterium]|nr:tryptophan synthase subunit alpha [Alphaproteobacteria bacterium]